MADERDLVSIIIPVYNSKERLGECLDSVVSQDGPPLEVIVVDDCSTDGSLELLRAYEERYPFVHVYTKENEGVSAARNYGLSRAAGNWIQFADSDDKLYPGAVKQLWERIRRDGSDVVIGGYWNEKENREVLYKDGLWGDKDSFMEEFPGLFTSFFIHVPWNKMYRREILEGVRFPEDLDKGEDLMFNLQVLERAEKISSLRQVLYFYHNVSGQSLSFRFREDAMEIEERLYREVERFWKKLNQGAPPLFLQQFFWMRRRISIIR